MDKLKVLKKRWEKSKLTAVFYHTTFTENVLSILKDKKIVANKGYSICKAENSIVSLSDRITKGIVEFFGNVVFEFDSVLLYSKNESIVPKSYGSSTDLRKYDEKPLCENEWFAQNEIRFNIKDIRKVFFITNKNTKISSFESLGKALSKKGIMSSFLCEKWLSDNMVTDMTAYLLRMRGWKRFIKENQKLMEAVM